MPNKNNAVLKALVSMLAVAIVVFFGGWAMTEWLPGFEWSMATIATIAGLIGLAAGPGVWVRLQASSDD